jgi:hypothetical protein
MYENVPYSQRRGDSRLVASEPAVSEMRHRRRARCHGKWKFGLLLLGCALFCGACANDDSSADNSQHRHHRHGNGNGREQMETVDRSNNPSPTPALGW